MTLRLNAEFSLQQADWRQHADALRSVRQRVFVQEQGVPADLEWDAEDATAVHFLAVDAQARPIGTARLRAGGQIGRMAVLTDWRGRGVGSALLQALLDAARSQGLRQVELHAQTHASGFYRRHGFEPIGAEFIEAGIPHQYMRRLL